MSAVVQRHFRPLLAARWPSTIPRPRSALNVTRRPFASSSHPPPSSSSSILLVSPTERDLEQAEQYVDLVPQDQARLQITDRAAEKLKALATNEKDPDLGLRIFVESGGCHGYQYKLELSSRRAQEDFLFSHPVVKPSNIFVDAVSLALLKGSTIDYATELIGSSFRVSDNPQAIGSGCGCGVSWELKPDAIL